MYNRLRDILCHPRYLGMYHKDSFLKIIGYVILFFSIFSLTTALYTYGQVEFSYEDAKTVTNQIQIGDSYDILYDKSTNTLTGDKAVYETTLISVCFLVDEVNTNSIVTLDFNDSYIDIYLYNMKAYNVLYSELNTNSFNILGVRNGNLDDIIVFQDLIDSLLDLSNNKFKMLYCLEMNFGCIGFYLGLLVFALIISYFHNSNIDLNIRIRLCLYSTCIYFIVMSISIMFVIPWLQIIALLIALMYTKSTFTHIVKRVKGV